MKKFKGMIDKKIIAIIIAVLVIGIGAYVFSQKGGLGAVSPKLKILNGIMGITDEYIKTLNDFTPEIGVEELYQKYEKDMTYTTEIDLNTDHFKMMGMDKAGLKILTKSNPKEKQMQADMGLKVGNIIGADISLIGAGDEYFVNIPSVYSKALKVNGKTIGEDLNNSVFKEMSPEFATEIEKYKDLQFDPYSIAYTREDIKKEYLAYVKEELSAFEKNLNVEKVDTDSKFVEKMKEFGAEKAETEQYNLKVKSEYLKPLLIKSLEYSNFRQIKAMKSEYLKEQYSKVFEEAKKDIENENFPEEVEMKVIMEKDKIIAFDFKPEENKDLTIYLLGEKNTTDKVVFNGKDEVKELSVISELKTAEDKNEISVKMDGEFDLIMTYMPKDMSMTGSLDTKGNNIMTMVGKYENVTKGSAFDFILDKLEIKDDSQSIVLNGKLKYDSAKPMIEKPAESVEILKVTKEEFEQISQEVMTNVQTNYGPLMMLMMGGGF